MSRHGRTMTVRLFAPVAAALVAAVVGCTPAPTAGPTTDAQEDWSEYARLACEPEVIADGDPPVLLDEPQRTEHQAAMDAWLAADPPEHVADFHAAVIELSEHGPHDADPETLAAGDKQRDEWWTLVRTDPRCADMRPRYAE